MPGGGGGVPSALCCRQRRTAASAMGGYELVRSDDAAGAPVADLESGAGANNKAPPPSPPPSPAARGQPRLVSLDVFRGITVLVRAHNLFLLHPLSTELNSRTN